MQELEKILEEIETEFDRRIDTQLKIMAGLSDDVYRYGYGKSLEAYKTGKLIAEEILRKHMNDGWIPVEERLPEPGRIVLITQAYSWENFEEGASVTIGRLSPEKNNKMWEFQYYRPDFRSGTIMDNDIICPGNEYVIAWRPLPEPYRPERGEGE